MSEPMLCGHTYFENANKCAACLEAENARLQRERNVLNEMWVSAEGENKKLEAANKRLRAALEEIRRIDTGPLNVQGHLGDIARRALEEKNE